MTYFMKNLPALCLLLSGCLQSTAVVNAGDKPDWLSGEPTSYPNASYITATGSASKPELAQDRALGNLVKVFELRIRESSTTTQDVRSHKSGGVETVEASARIASQVNIQTDKMVQGARIAERWQNPDDLTYYALAVLDRAQAGNNIREEINRLDREIAFTMSAVDSKTDPLLKVADLQDAITMQQERTALQGTLKIIDLRGRGKPSSWNTAELREQQEQALRSLNMSGQVREDTIGGLDKILHGAMANAGFANSGNSNGYILSSSLQTQEPLQREGWYWLRGSLNLRLTDPQGTVLGNKTWPLKVSAQQQGQLDDRMRAEVDKKLKKELKTAVLGFATGGQ